MRAKTKPKSIPRSLAVSGPRPSRVVHNACIDISSSMRRTPPQSLPSPQLLDELSGFFRLLSEPARLQLLCQLKHGGAMDVSSLIEATGFSQSHISRQLGQLQRAGLVSCERDGTRLIYAVADPLVDDLCNLVQRRLKQRLEEQLRQLQGV
jgi:DNA-binding transcriptional ArsR family regulator